MDILKGNFSFNESIQQHRGDMRDFCEYSLEKPCSQITERQSVMQLLCTEYGEELQILMTYPLNSCFPWQAFGTEGAKNLL